MYNKKYRFAKIEQFGRYNPIYEDMEGRVCYPAYLKVGERGWLLYEREDEWDRVPHRLHLSIIKTVEILHTIGTIIITTENTRLTLEVV